MRQSEYFHIKLVLSIVMVISVISCSKKQENSSVGESSPLAQALDDWRAAGGVVNVSEISSGSASGGGGDQNAATLHAYLFDEVARISESDLELLNEPWDAERSQIDSLARFYATTIDQIKTAARAPYCDWEIDYSQGFDAKIPYSAYIRSAARLLRADAIAKIDSGDVDGAVESLKCGILLSRQAAQADVPIVILVGISIEIMITDTVDQLCKDEPKLSLSALKPILSSQDLRPLLGQAVMNEATLMLGEMRRMRLGSREAALDDSIDPNFSREIVEYLNSVRAYAEEMSDPLYQQQPGLVVPVAPDSWRQSLRIKEVSFDSDNRNLDWVAIQRIFAKMAIDLREEKLHTGRYPDPATVAKVIDPYDGGTIKYELNPDGGFTLTSSAKAGEPAEPIVWNWK